jgi:lysozyme
MKNTITTLILALLLFSGCVNSTKQNTQHNEEICETHHLNCYKLAEKGIKGIDISHHNGIINWERIDTTEVKFVIIKSTEGDSSKHTDSLFKTNWNKCLEKKLIVGAYHIFGIKSSGMKQFNNYISVVPKLNNSMPPLIDVNILSRAKDISKLIKELKILENELHIYYGKKPIIYCQEYYYHRDIANNFKNNKVWLKNYGKKLPSVLETKRGIWQYSETGQCYGITGNVDMDYFNGNISSFNEFIDNH